MQHSSPQGHSLARGIPQHGALTGLLEGEQASPLPPPPSPPGRAGGSVSLQPLFGVTSGCRPALGRTPALSRLLTCIAMSPIQWCVQLAEGSFFSVHASDFTS